MPSRKHAARFAGVWRDLHNYVSFSADDYKQENGMKYHTYPSLKSNEDRLALWDGLLRNDLQTMATDEYCTTFAFKIQGQRIDDVTGGHNGAETRVGITYNEGVVKRGMSLPRFVDVVSANAARLLGLYPRKGAIAPGATRMSCLSTRASRKTQHGRPAHQRLQHLGMGHPWLAIVHHAARQDHGGRRPASRQIRGWPTHPAQNRPHCAEPPGLLRSLSRLPPSRWERAGVGQGTSSGVLFWRL